MAQLLLALLDAALASCLLSLGTIWYPEPLGPGAMLVWPVALVAVLFVFRPLGAYSLSSVMAQGPAMALRMTAQAFLAGLLSYPFLSGADTHRVTLLAVLIPITALGLVLLRLVFGRLAMLRSPPIACFLLSSRSTLERLQEAESDLSLHYQIGEAVILDGSREDNLFRVKKLLNTSPPLVVCDFGSSFDEDVHAAVFSGVAQGLSIVDFISFYSGVTGRVPLDVIDLSWLLQHSLSSAYGYVQRVRRIVSVVAGSLLLVLASPVMLLIAVAIVIDTGRPVLFKQERLGRFHRPFQLIKFRSMVTDAEEHGPVAATHGDPRITRVGRLIRKTRLDELPQLVNLVRGDLSLIGPRPRRPHFANELSQRNPIYDVRLLYPPGLTGWAQVLGPAGESDADEIAKLEMDIYYFKSGGLLHDLYVLFKTVQLMVGLGGK